MPTTLTSAIGATPTMSNAARTFCQKRIRGRRILPLPCPTRLLFVLLPARLAASSADSVSGPSHRTASVRTRNVLVRGFISKSERAQRLPWLGDEHAGEQVRAPLRSRVARGSVLRASRRPAASRRGGESGGERTGRRACSPDPATGPATATPLDPRPPC